MSSRGLVAVLASWAVAGLCSVAVLVPASASAASQPIEMAAPYEYLGWGDPQPPASVIAATGVRDLTLAFILTHGKCNPEWDGERPLLGGSDEAAIESIRAAGGEVDVSFGAGAARSSAAHARPPPRSQAPTRR